MQGDWKWGRSLGRVRPGQDPEGKPPGLTLASVDFWLPMALFHIPHTDNSPLSSCLGKGQNIAPQGSQPPYPASPTMEEGLGQCTVAAITSTPENNSRGCSPDKGPRTQGRSGSIELGQGVPCVAGTHRTVQQPPLQDTLLRGLHLQT